MTDTRDEQIEQLQAEVAFYKAAAGLCTQCRSQRDILDPVRFITEERDSGWVANIVVSLGATGHGTTERAARRSAATGLQSVLEDILDEHI